ncbi:xanthine dehydrogenase 1 isoform X1 [Cinnamomum micranthum f. kanehirae]|uniref:xanthine dehydrogenase n=1 Tax=Cinnamomum micranthum f. kanehirae TaxID=337451 RepID=A0A443NBY7_9MAGN|nr:xanthine dehydrogenase 1 isoform X1 [Cinnamomum micranthum f. kanehirae]
MKHNLICVQESLANAHGSQCGFCTPGFVMSMYALLRSCETPPSEEQIEEYLAGNLCRCTGYRPIIDAFRVFAKTDNALYTNSSSASSSKEDFICPSTGKPCSCGGKAVNHDEISSESVQGESYKLLCYSEINGSSYSEKELIFPPELLLRKIAPLKLSGFGALKWYRPLRLKHVLDLKLRYPDAKLVVGNSEVGIETKFKNVQYQVQISVTHVPELNALSVRDDGLEIGAAVRLTELQKVLRKAVAERDAHETSSCKAFIEQLKWFAGTQIKNVASVGGNICTASPISDLNPLWMAAGAKFRIIDCKENVRTTQAKDFFVGYRKVDMRPGEILLSIFLPWTRPFEFVKEFKQAHRRDDDIAIVNAGMRVFLEEREGKWAVSDASVVYGGVAPVSLSASKTECFLAGKSWDTELLQGALDKLSEDISLPENVPGGMAEFRRSLTLSFFFKFFLWVAQHMERKISLLKSFPLSFRSAILSSNRPPSSGIQSFEVEKQGTAVGLPTVHLSAKLQACLPSFVVLPNTYACLIIYVSGEAEYADDTPMPPNGLHAALVTSRKAHARIVSIDDSGANSSPGFRGFFTSKDIPGSNKVGPVVYDEELFASEFVTCVGQVIGVVVADTHENARSAARKINIEYKELPAVLSIRDALQFNSFHPNTERCLKKGDVEFCFQSGACDKIIEGDVQVGGQEHFYLEPHSTVIWTLDGGNEVHMISSTQAPQKHQKYVARVLNLPFSKVVCKTKRIGGGFGGKETRSAFIAAAAAVPSYLLNQPVKLTLDRDVDMMITGQRHSFLGRYKVGFTNEGKLLALDLEVYNNAGNSLDLSLAILERAMFHSDNVYDIPHIRVRGKVCFTNFPSHTAFRGFGGPQGMLITENWIQRIAMELKKSPEEIREINFQSDGSLLHYGHRLQYCTLKQVWNELKASCDFSKAREAADQFNLHNRWKKRGVAMVPTKFGISFTTKFMNQAGALVHVYTDGTVLVTHGGVEMGQGLHTKLAQIAASSFNIPLSSVFISDTSTDKVPNASPTAASASSDMYGGAVLDACEQINSRMKPVASKRENLSFAEWASVQLLHYGAAFVEVEIDTLTGDFHTRTADVVMDLGYSLNPAIDIGQVWDGVDGIAIDRIRGAQFGILLGFWLGSEGFGLLEVAGFFGSGMVLGLVDGYKGTRWNRDGFIEGAFVQGLGWVALEELKWGDPAHKWIAPGSLYTFGPGSYKIPSVNDIPLKFKVSLLKGVPNVKAIHSSKAVGEPPFFLASAALFAIKDAIIAARADAGCNDWFPLDNPATPERIRMACMDDFIKSFASPDFRAKLSV